MVFNSAVGVVELIADWWASGWRSWQGDYVLVCRRAELRVVLRSKRGRISHTYYAPVEMHNCLKVVNRNGVT